MQIIFIVNPVSGTVNKKGIVAAIEKWVDRGKFDLSIRYTEYAGHATKIAAEAAATGVEIVAAVGGDGTVNEIASALLHTNTSLYIVPAGSGNGLARHLCIPVDPVKALIHLNKAKPAVIDSCAINGRPFFCTSGIGFDARISHEFARQKKRGLMTYIKTSVRGFSTFQPQTYQLDINGTQSRTSAFLITVANAAQYGNNAYICPQADISDGWMDVCLVRPFSGWRALAFAAGLFRGTLHRSRMTEMLRTREVWIDKQEDEIHLDGEPVLMPGRLHYTIHPGSLKVWH